MKANAVKVFISFASKDLERYRRAFVESIEATIAANSKNGTQAPNIEIFMSENELKAGDDWKKRTLSSLDGADVVIMLLSTHFFASEFISREELPRIIHGWKEKKIVVFAVHFVQIGRLEEYAETAKIHLFNSSVIGHKSYASKYDTDPDKDDWKFEYASDLYGKLVDQIEIRTSDAPEVRELRADTTQSLQTKKIERVADFPHVYAAMNGQRLRRFVTIKPTTKLDRASLLLFRSKPRVRHIIIENNGDLFGIFSYRDALKVEMNYIEHDGNRQYDPSTGDIEIGRSEHFTRNVVSCNTDDGIRSAVEKFANKQGLTSTKVYIGALPVLHLGKVVEVLSYTDILKEWELILPDNQVENLKRLTAREIMTTGVELTSEQQTIDATYNQISRNGRRTVTAIDHDNRFSGMISDLTISDKYSLGVHEAQICEFIRKPNEGLETFSETTSFAEMTRIFQTEKDLTSLPVLSADFKVLGIVSYTDLLGKMLGSRHD